MKLYDLPQRTKNGIKIYGLKDLENKDVVVIFGHLDGAYSYCWIHDPKFDSREKIVHLSASTPLVKHGDGYKVADEA
jgi:hypothetical protein